MCPISRPSHFCLALQASYPPPVVRPRRLFFALAAILLATGAFAPRQLLAQQADVIRGRVTGPDSLAVEGVTVTATSISGGVNRTTRTDKNGRFTITFPNGDGD